MPYVVLDWHACVVDECDDYDEALELAITENCAGIEDDEGNLVWEADT